MTQPVQDTTAAKELSKKELDALREFHISLNWRGLKKAVRKVTYELPFAGFQNACLFVEGVSRKLTMNTKPSWWQLPVGITLRNTSRAMYNSSADRYWLLPRLVGGVLTAGAIIGFVGLVAAPAVAAGVVAAGAMAGLNLATAGSAISIFGLPVLAAGAAVTTAAAATTAGFLTTLGALTTFALVGIPVATLAAYPVFTVATLAASTTIGAIIAPLSAVASLLNIPAGIRRARAAKKGVELSPQQIDALQTEFDRESPFASLEDDHPVKAYFNKAAAKAAAKEAAVAAPAPAPKADAAS